MKALTRDSLRIVHVDDDPDFVEITERSLNRAGFKHPIVHCLDGARAIEYFTVAQPESAPHVILLDLHMPQKNGLEVLQWIRRTYVDQNVAVYLLTSSEDPAHKSQAEAEKVTKYFLKKSYFEELTASLDHLIATRNEPTPAEADRFPIDWLPGLDLE